MNLTQEVFIRAYYFQCCAFDEPTGFHVTNPLFNTNFYSEWPDYTLSISIYDDDNWLLAEAQRMIDYVLKPKMYDYTARRMVLVDGKYQYVGFEGSKVKE